MKCEKCGKEIKHLEIDMFNYDGSDEWRETQFEEQPNGAVTIETNPAWTGYEMSYDEMCESIRCPECKQYPFEDKIIDAQIIVSVIMWKTEEKQNDK